MKTLAFAFLLTFGLTLPALALQDGTYKCTKGNEASICPQVITVIKSGNKMTGLKVFYSGYCNDQGPYFYDCAGGVCGDDAIKYSKIKRTSFYWENQPNGFYCSFNKK